MTEKTHLPFLHALAVVMGMMACWPSCASTPTQYEYSVMSPNVTQSLMVDVVLAGNRLVAVGERGHIIFSDTQGKQWTQAKVPTRVLITAVFFIDDSDGWAVGHDAVILHSADGGETWDEQYSHQVGSSSPLVEDDRWVDKVDRSGTPLLDLWFKNSKEGFAVGAYGYFLHTENGGLTWEDWTNHIDNPDGWHFNNIVALSDNVLLVVGEKGIIYRSDNDGQDWNQISSPYDGSYFGAVALKSSNVALIFGLQGNIYRTLDKGETWVSVDSGVQAGLNSGAVLTDGSIVIVGNTGVVLRSHNGGTNFTITVIEDRKSLVGISPSSDGKTLIFAGQGGVTNVPLGGLLTPCRVNSPCQ